MKNPIPARLKELRRYLHLEQIGILLISMAAVIGIALSFVEAFS